MTEQLDVKRCGVGSATDNPCTRPATERVNVGADEASDVCLVHATSIEVGDILDEAIHALERLRRRERELR